MKTIKPRRVDLQRPLQVEKRGILVFMVYVFDVDIAAEFGVNEAIMMQNFAYWIGKNAANDKNFHDGRYWTYNSVEAFAKLFPFWNAAQVRHILKNLIDKGILVKGNYNTVGRDRTCWYAFTDAICQKYYSHLIKLTNGFDTFDKCSNNIIEEDSNINTNINANSNIYPAAPKKSVVRQTSEKLCLFADSKFADFEDFKKMFVGPEYEQIDLYYYHQVIMDWSASKGAKKRDWIATARNWMRSDKEKNKLHLIDTGMSDAFVAHFQQMAELFG